MDTKEQFFADLELAKKTEREISEIIVKRFGLSQVKFNNDYRFDFEGIDKEKKIYSFEIKEDFTCSRTGNIGIEYSCRGRKSGIERTLADFYVIKAHKENGYDIVLISVSTLKSMIKEKKYIRTVQGGSKESKSFNYLFKKHDLFKNGWMM